MSADVSHNEAARQALAGPRHEVKRDLAGELDQSVVLCFRDDQDALDMRVYACAACETSEF